MKTTKESDVPGGVPNYMYLLSYQALVDLPWRVPGANLFDLLEHPVELSAGLLQRPGLRPGHAGLEKVNLRGKTKDIVCAKS